MDQVWSIGTSMHSERARQRVLALLCLWRMASSDVVDHMSLGEGTVCTPPRAAASRTFHYDWKQVDMQLKLKKRVRGVLTKPSFDPFMDRLKHLDMDDWWSPPSVSPSCGCTLGVERSSIDGEVQVLVKEDLLNRDSSIVLFSSMSDEEKIAHFRKQLALGFAGVLLRLNYTMRALNLDRIEMEVWQDTFISVLLEQKITSEQDDFFKEVETLREPLRLAFSASARDFKTTIWRHELAQLEWHFKKLAAGAGEKWEQEEADPFELEAIRIKREDQAAREEQLLEKSFQKAEETWKKCYDVMKTSESELGSEAAGVYQPLWQ